MMIEKQFGPKSRSGRCVPGAVKSFVESWKEKLEPQPGKEKLPSSQGEDRRVTLREPK